MYISRALGYDARTSERGQKVHQLFFHKLVPVHFGDQKI